ncbi:MAG: transposase [Ideonella sp.]|nr:transposase [Ideonella sp.]MCC7456255.1 hypothetical protein [Nitrospira sp.]
MARLPRLAIADCVHLVRLRGHNGQSVFADTTDRGRFLADLHSAFERERVALHGYALAGEQVWLVGTPPEARALSRAMQALGRGFAAAFNRRHGRRGALWDGRFRATVVEGGATVLSVLVFVDQAADGAAPDGEAASLWSSAPQHLGAGGELVLTHAAEYWDLGNTPFDRATAYGRLLAEPLASGEVERIRSAVERGWAIGSPRFVASLGGRLSRPVAPRPRGRPRKIATPNGDSG